jgi:asparagine synthase (glutamine-hydrolysing)
MSSSAATIATTAISTRTITDACRRAYAAYVLGPTLEWIPSAGWYKSIGHQLRWLHRLSFLEGGERYASSLNYFYFDPAMRAGLFTAAALEELTDAHAEAAIEDPYERLTGDPLDRMLYADSQIRLPDHPVMITDRMTMAHSLEARSPFMDHCVAEFAARLPSSLKIRGRSLRYIQRKLAARYLPPEILARPKQGFSSALPYVLGKEYRLLYARLPGRLPSSCKAGILRRAPVQELLRAHLAGHVDHGNRLWLLINSELWYRMMILGQSRADLRLDLTAAPVRASA